MQTIFESLSRPYKIAVFLSATSMAFGILREFLLIAFIGFSSRNDTLQLYLSIFYTIGLSIDAMRLGCLNLYTILSLQRILFIASLIALPFSIGIGFMMYCSTRGLSIELLSITIMGSYLNLIVALFITYKQRNHSFLMAQIINVMPNFILIPGLVFCYWYAPEHLVTTMIYLTCAIPVVQFLFLLLLPHEAQNLEPSNTISLWASLMIFVRHFSAMIGEQFFQMVARTAFYHYGVGYLSLFSFAVRIYSACRFIMIDSFIGAKLANWKAEMASIDVYLEKLIRKTVIGSLVLIFALMISLQSPISLFYSAIQITCLLFFGFYFSTLVRIIYFKINCFENNSTIILRFALYELMIAFIAYLLTKQTSYPLLALIWIGYIAKPFLQLLLLKRRYQGLELKMD